MSHKFKYIEDVYFDDVAGKIGNAYIYSLDFSQGYSSEASKLTIHAVNEDGDFSSLPNPNFDDVYTVKIGNKVIFKGYIITKNKKFSGTEKTASITLVDRSVKLDQYGIGLIQRHAIGAKQETTINVEAIGVDPFAGTRIPATIPFERDLADTKHSGPIRAGNLYVIGREIFTSSPCDIPDIEYLSYHFNAAMSMFSSDTGISFQNLPTIITGRNYAGTIRDVLNSLCSDQGLSFYYDASSDSILVFALEGKRIDDSIIETLKNDPNITITDYNESQTLEGTFANQVSIREMRPGKEKSKNKKCNINVDDNLIVHGPFHPSRSGHFGGLATLNHARYGMVTQLSGGLRDYLCATEGEYGRIGISAANLIENRSFTTVTVHVADDCGHLSQTQVPSSKACLDDNPTNLENSNCPLVRLAVNVGLAPDELIQVFENKPVLYYGYRAELVRVEDDLKDYWMAEESRAVQSMDVLYKARYSPIDIDNYNKQSNSIDNPNVQDCQNVNYVQSPEPQWVEPPYGIPGWYFTGGTGVTVSSPPLDGAVDQLSPAFIAITANMAHALNINWDNPCASNYFTHLMFTPTMANISAVLTTETMDAIGDFVGNQYEFEDSGANCVVAGLSRSVNTRKFKKASSGCRGSCNDTTIDEYFAYNHEGLEICGERQLPSGPICQMKRAVLKGTFDLPNFGFAINFYVMAPWYSIAAYRSNVSIEFNSNETTELSSEIDLQGFGNPNEVAKLNISDIDATSEIFDPDSVSNHYIKAPSENIRFEDIKKSVKDSFSGFGGTPRSISISLVGMPTNLSLALDMNSINSYSISYGSDGISMSLDYADAPRTPPTQDYLQSKLHSQFHYTTMNRR